MNNEEYIEKLINEIKQFNKYLEIRAEILPNEEFCGKTVESATLDEIDKLKKFYESAISIIEYYSYTKRSTNYINQLSPLISYMLFLLSSNLTDYFAMLDNFMNKTQKYNEVLLDNKIKFNRALICSSILYDDYPEQNQFIQKLKSSIKHTPLTKEELDTISKFSDDDMYVWKHINLL